MQDGVLGCPNCRDSLPITDGFADLRAPPRGDLPGGLAGSAPSHGESDEPGLADDVQRLCALLGIQRGPGVVALLGASARHASGVASTVEDLLIVAIDPDLVTWEDAPGVSRAAAGPGLPFFSRALRGVVVDGRLGRGWIEEAIRVVAPMSRVIVLRSPDWTSGLLAEAGLTILASETETVVAARG